MEIKRSGRRFFRRALRDERGGILVTAALSMLPITMLAFAAVEFHNFTRQRTALQDALDSAALAVARAPISATQDQLRTLYIAVLRSHLDLKQDVVTLVVADPNPATGAGAQPSLTYANGVVTVSASLAISPIIASFFMDGDLIVTGGSTIRREARGLEVALVMDNTGSMTTNNRIGIAKTAAVNFVNALEAATTGTTSPNAVKIGLVPFSHTVNVGSTYNTSSNTWLDRNAQSPIAGEIFRSATGQTLATAPNRFTLLSQMSIAWGGCVESRPSPYDVQDTAPSTTVPATLFVPYFAPDEPDYLPAGTPARYNNSNNWNATRALNTLESQNSYVWDLKQAVTGSSKSGNDQILGGLWSGYRIDFSVSNPDYLTRLRTHTNNGDASVLYHSGVLGTPLKYTAANLNSELADPWRPTDGFTRTNTVRGPNQGCNIQPLTRLTNSYSTVRTAINAMVADGATNIPMGLVWGWHLLSPNAPFNDGAAYNTQGVTKVVLLMTDGDNSVSGWDYTGIGYGFQGRLGTTSMDSGVLGAALNTRMGQLCTNMKASGIVIYTVRVEVTGGDPSPMRNCASGTDKFFDVSSASALDATFREIARSIQNLRIAA